jgi:hypothetical protein
MSSGDYLARHMNNDVAYGTGGKPVGVEDTRFECVVCTHILPKEEMSQVQDVCTTCEAKRDDHPWE